MSKNPSGQSGGGRLQPPASRGASTVASGSAAPESLLQKAQEDLVAKQKALDLEQIQVTTDTRDRDSLKAQVSHLTSVVNEIKQAVEGVGQASPDPNDVLQELADYHDAKVKMVASVLGNKTEDIDDLFETYKTKIDDQTQQVQEDVDGLAAAGQANETAQEELNAAQRQYDGWKAYLKTVQASLKSADLRKVIEDQEGNHQDPKWAEKAYGLLKLMQELLPDPESLLTKDELKHNLDGAWQQLRTAKDSVEEAQSDWKSAQAKLDASKKALKALIDDRTKNLLSAAAGGNGS